MQFLHSMIRVKNEAQSIKFYCDLLGLKKGRKIELDDCYLQYLFDEKTNIELELTVNNEIPESGYQTGDAFGHFAFSCENLDEFEKRMKNLGYDWDLAPFYLDEIKTRICFLKDPDGNSIELIEKNS